MQETSGATSATPAPAAETQPRSEKIELMQQMPAGSVGVVHKAKNPKLDRVVALRQMQVPEWLDNADELIQRMLTEARAANALTHTNISQMLTAGFKGFTVFLSSDFVEGKGLKEFVIGHNPSLPEVMDLTRQLCAALQYAGEKKVVHPALNFSNIKVTADGVVKVLDYGLLRDKNVYAPSPAKRLENEHYLSPEQVKNRPVTYVSNLFSLATIVYELFTTRNPFAGRHLGEVDRNITDVEPHSASVAHSRVPEPVARVLAKALAKNPADRFQSAQAMLDALEEAMTAPAAAKVAATAPSKAAVTPPPAKAATPFAAGTAQPANSSAAGFSTGVAPSAMPAVPAAAPRPAVTPIPPSPPVRPPMPKSASTTSRMPAMTEPVKPVKMPAKRMAQWKLAAGIVVGVFVIAAVAVSFRRSSDVTPPPNSAPAQDALLAPVPTSTPAATGSPSSTEPDPQPEIVGQPRRTPAKTKNAKPEPALVGVAPATEGQLAVTSVPDGAIIEIGGRTTDGWRTPQTIATLAPGMYSVTISKAGYASETRAVQITSGNRSAIDVKLNPLKATLTVAGTPPGAGIQIDGKPTGRFTPAEFTMEPGSHNITLRKEGYFDSTGDVKLTAGQTVSYSPSLSAAGRTDNIRVVGGGVKKLFGGNGNTQGMARMEIKSEPKGAQVTINGSTLPKPTPVEIQVEPGNYEITLQKDGFKPVHKSVVAEASGKISISEQLPQ